MGVPVSQFSDQELRDFIKTAMIERTEIVRTAINELSQATSQQEKRYAAPNEVDDIIEEIFEKYDDVLRALA